MGHPDHLNAAELLPEEELRKLSDLLDGRSAYLWLPSRDSLNRRRRGDYIAMLRKKGIPIPEIARRLNLSERHVQRILAKKRKADCAPASTTGDERRAGRPMNFFDTGGHHETGRTRSRDALPGLPGQ